MIISLMAPLLTALVIAALATSAHRRLPPRLAARFVTIALAFVVVAAVPTVLVIALAFVAHLPVIGVGFRWCAMAIGLHQAIPLHVGLPSLALVGLGGFRVARLLHRHRTLRVDRCAEMSPGASRARPGDLAPISVARSATPYAVTLPGRAGQIVVSTALLELLDDDEQRVVIAHERAHARHRHDRYLLVAELAAAALPPLRALAGRVGYSVERWADEIAAHVCGDREFVAVTLGKVALHTSPATVAGFSGLGVAARMGALLEPPVRRPRRVHLVALWCSLATTAGFSLYQLHHVERLIAVLCPH